MTMTRAEAEATIQTHTPATAGTTITTGDVLGGDAGLAAKYRALDRELPMRGVEAIDTACLLTFPYPEDGAAQEIAIDTDEFTAVCPWTGLPDYGTLLVRYTPGRACLELKSLKYYLLSYRDVGIVQEHATDRILRDLAAACAPRGMTVTLDYKVRGGLHTVTTAVHGGDGH